MAGAVPPCPHILDVLSRSAKHQENRKRQVNSHIEELGRSVSFSREVFSRTNPRENYVSAKEHAGDLFHAASMPVPLHEPTVSGLSGRHNPRGSGIKHLPCYLEDRPNTRGVVISEPKQPGQNLKLRLRSISCEDESHNKARFLHYGEAKFQDAIMGGAKPLYPSDSTICLDNGTRYKKTLQQKFPKPPGEYTMAENKETRKMYGKGQRPERWMDFPQLTKSSSHKWVLRSPTESPSRQVQTLDKPRPAVEGQEFFNIMKEWASQKKIHLQLKDVPPPNVLLRNTHSLSNRIKMSAALAVVLLAEDKASSRNPASHALPANGEESQDWDMELVSEDMVASLERLLEEKEVTYVKVPCAVALYAVNRHSDKPETVLMGAIHDESEEERWASVQCLVHAGSHSAPVIKTLLQYLFNDHNPSKQDQATQLLVLVSCHTGLVFHMLADRLNTSSWRERLVTCRTLSRLHGSMSRDLCSKLLVCAWEDWSVEVQQAAAQTLGVTGHGKMIHDEIATRLANSSEMVKLDAVKKLRSLGVMTSRVLPGYLDCFTDEHLSIQHEALAVAGELKLQHPLVIKAIKLLLQDSRVWSIKTAALKALGQVGHRDQDLMQLLIWMVRFEKVAAVRAEGCRTIGQLGLTDDDVIDRLKALVTVEDDKEVVTEARRTLARLGHEDGVKDDMLESVCKTVREMGSKNAITTTIVDSATKVMTDYVVDDRPLKTLSARDYLNHEHRSKTFQDNAAHLSQTSAMDSPYPNWGPDRQFIDSKLQDIRTRLDQLYK